MKDKLKIIARLWRFTFLVSLLTIIVYHAIPRFGTLIGDLELNCSGLRIPLVSCSLLALAVVLIWIQMNWKNL